MLARRLPTRAVLHARRLSSETALLTRSAKFRAHVFDLHRKQPERWTDAALAQHFQVPLHNIQGALVLQQLEADHSAQSESLDPELIALDEDIEEYMCHDEQQPAAPRSAAEASPAEADPWAADGSLEQMSPEQEQRLAAAFSRRFANASVEETLDALSPAELQQLGQQLCESLAEGEGVTVSDEGTSEGDEVRREALRGLLSTLALEVAPQLLGEGPIDLAQHKLPPTALPAPSPGERPPAAEAAALQDSGVTQIGVQSQVSIAGTPMMPSFRVVEDRGPDPAMYFTREKLKQLRKPRKPESGEQLAINLKLRDERLSPDRVNHFKKTGQLVFAEVHKPNGRTPTTIERVWVSEKDRTVRDADDDETDRATRRVLPKQFAPRIKRNA